ncbi:hypothetical protein L0F63_000510 [Massospora cicadina]|nr:hypothetical protein L0F63_000510 [Massospora cicadina]
MAAKVSKVNTAAPKVHSAEAAGAGPAETSSISTAKREAGSSKRGTNSEVYNENLGAGDKGEGSSSDEDEESFPYIQRQVHVECPFANCPNAGEVFTDPTSLPPHLRLHHRLHFRNLYHMTSALQAYLSNWAARLETQPPETFLPAQEDERGKYYVIGPETFPDDEGIRREVQQAKLKEVLAFQDLERQGVAKHPHACLFCSAVAGNRGEVFRHMFAEHGFNIGLPDNLVYTAELLARLRGKLATDTCLYCDRVFKSQKVLRMHMRKKKHFRIHPRNHAYDKFYVINYAEPGKPWDVLERERAAEKRLPPQAREIEPEDSWDGWDDELLRVPAAALAYDKAKYGFDLEEFIQSLGLDFYKSVTLVNFVRHQTAQGRCIGCRANQADLPAHYAANKCLQGFSLALQDPLWQDPTYLVPTIENDPMLMYLGDSADDACGESSHSETPHLGLASAQNLPHAGAASSVSTSQ